MPLFDAVAQAMPTPAANRLCAPLAELLAHGPAAWREVIEPWRYSEAGQSLVAFVDARVAAGAAVYPRDVLCALRLTSLADVRAVILGQDPYHGPGQAQGLAFSVPAGVRTPPSLRNILAELQRDTGVRLQGNDLSGWARQGVLLLNTALTVEDGQPASHARRGWEPLTQAIMSAVAQRGAACAYFLWGAHAQQAESLIRAAAPSGGVPPLILKANHPSPLSARRAPVPFVGCGHFGEATRYLARNGTGVDWAAAFAEPVGHVS